MSSRRHLDRKRPAVKQSSRALAGMHLFTPQDIALWARRRGLLSVYLGILPAQGLYPPCWQVVRPGYRTDPSAPAWQRGCKTFLFTTPAERLQAERSARAWSSAHFNVDGWARIEGIPGALFPDAVAAALQVISPEIIIARDRHPVRA